MANSRNGNKIFADSTGAAVTGSAVKVAYIVFTPNAANDECLLKETASGSDVFYFRAATAKETKVYDFSRRPVVFQNGLYIQTLTSGAKVIFVTTSTGDV